MVSITNSFFTYTCGFFCASILTAQAVTVQEISVDPNKVVPISVTDFYTGSVYAGIVKLKVDGQSMDGFCIDPFHFSVTTGEFNYVPLSQAPKSFIDPVTHQTIDEAMAANAIIITNLWSINYNPLMPAL